MGAVISKYKQIKRLRGFTDAGGLVQPLTGVVTAVEGANPRPMDYFDGLLWGVNGSNQLCSSADWLTTATPTWSVRNATGIASILRVTKCSDGEVLIIAPTGAHKSSGWSVNPTTATWSLVASSTTANANFLPWGFDHDETGSKFILTEYVGGIGGAGGDRRDSRYGRISVDGGSTFENKYDSEALHGVAFNEFGHLHGCCYDPWLNNGLGGFWLSDGHNINDVATGDAGLYYSIDDGDTWTQLFGQGDEHSAGDYPRVQVATTITACEHGLILGTDSIPPGIWRIPRTADMEDSYAEQIFYWRNDQDISGLFGFADKGYRDPDTGLIYVGFVGNTVGAAAAKGIIAASDGRTASQVMQSEEDGSRFYEVVAAKGRLAAAQLIGATWKHTYAYTTPVLKSANDPSAVDTGMVLGGTIVEQDSLAVGPHVSIGAASNRSIAIGPGISGPQIPASTFDVIVVGTGLTVGAGAYQIVQIGNETTTEAAGAGTVLIGHSGDGTGIEGVGVGISVSFASRSVAVGGFASAGGQAVSTGWGSSSGFGGTATGYDANAGDSSTSSGHSANAFGVFTCSTGAGSAATALYAIADGYQAIAAHEHSVVIGDQLTSTATWQVKFGPRHIELSEMTAPGAPAANGGRLYLEDDANGVTRLMLHTSGGINQLSPDKLRSYTVGTLPAVTAGDGAMVYVTDEVDGEVPAFCDGTNWLRFTDRAIVSGAPVLYLLDEFPGATVAYSYRKLADAWSEGFFTGTPNASAWLDQSGGDNDLTDDGQSSRQPLIVETGLQFDGANHYLLDDVTIAQPLTLFLRFTAGTYIPEHEAGLNNLIEGTNVVIRRISATLAEVYAGSFLTQTLPIANAEAMLLTVLLDGAGSKIWKNGTLFAEADAGASSLGGLVVGASALGFRLANHTAHEFVVYPSDVTVNRAEIEALLSA